jgi:multidrug resistance efflux pump
MALSEQMIARPAAAPERTAPKEARAPSPPLLRPQAVDAQARRDAEGSLLRANPRWVRGLFFVVASLLSIAVVGASIASVETTSRGPAVLRAPGGAHPVVVQVNGPVSEVLVKPGDSVAGGDPIVRVDSALVKMEMIDAETRVSLARAALERASGEESRLSEARLALLDLQAQLLSRKERSAEETVVRFRSRLDSYDRLASHGDIARSARDDVTEELARAIRDQIGTQEEMARVRSQRIAGQLEQNASVWKAKQELETAESKLRALELALDQTTVRAPAAGSVEALLVHPGDVLQAGAPIAHLVPAGAPTEIVAFLPERDRAFVADGSPARIEIDQLPSGEFGPLHAIVRRVSHDLASAGEAREALGEDAKLLEPMYRVELSLVDDTQRQRLAPLVRPGMLASARFTLRRRRVIGMIFSPLRKWLDS